MSDVKPAQKYRDPQKALYARKDWAQIGKSAGGKTIFARHLVSEKEPLGRILLIGGVHGNETEGVAFMQGFIEEFVVNNDYSPFEYDIFVIPVLNPDGFLQHERRNGNKVDLNRNLPTKDWSPKFEHDKYNPGRSAGSEPENRALVKILNSFKPHYIISFHSWKPMINLNGPAAPYAEAMKKNLDMIITEDIGYPTPGSLGTYTGWERHIPTITLEFERGIDLDRIYPYARDGVLESFKMLDKKGR